MEEIKETDRKKALFRMICIVMVALLFVPLLYSGIYLSAFWDPYSRFDKVPVAFVNQDQPVVRDGKTYHLGQDIQDSIEDNKSIGWHFVSYDEAKRGIRGATYYALIVIPADFSKKIAEAKKGKLERPSIIYEGNKGKNYVFAQVSQRAAENIKEKITGTIQKEAVKALTKGLYDVKDSLKDASDGAHDLQTGTKKLAAGSSRLSAGIHDAANGSQKLQDGLEKAAAGQTKLSTGLNTLVDGLEQFKGGITQSASDISVLSEGAKTVSNRLQQLTTAIDQANLSQGLTASADSISQLKEALSQASSLLEKTNDPASIARAREIVAQLITTMNDQDLEKRLTTSASAADDLISILKRLKRGAEKVAEGTKALESAAQGVDQLLDGAKKLQSGSHDLQKGLNTAANKTAELTTGLTKLETGAKQLNAGIDSANQGAGKLQDGLKAGYEKMNDHLTFTVEGISNYVKNPLAIKDKTINKVKYYGEGLAPYFISLSLWLGAMLINLVLSLTKLTDVVKTKFLKTYFRTFISGSILVMIQAVILSLVLVFGMGIDTVNQPLFFLGNMFISVVFFTIMYGLTYAIGLIGTPIVFILFILQLASSGGTFPIETAPKFFRVLSPFFPMTYTVEGLRMITSGITASRLMTITTILAVFLLIFLIGGYILNRAFKGLRTIKAELD